MGEVKQINIKNGTYYFPNDIIDLKNFEPSLLKIDKKLHKKMVFTTLDTSRLKELMIMRAFIVGIICIYVLIMQEDILKKKWK